MLFFPVFMPFMWFFYHWIGIYHFFSLAVIPTRIEVFIDYFQSWIFVVCLFCVESQNFEPPFYIVKKKYKKKKKKKDSAFLQLFWVTFEELALIWIVEY